MNQHDWNCLKSFVKSYLEGCRDSVTRSERLVEWNEGRVQGVESILEEMERMEAKK